MLTSGCVTHREQWKRPVESYIDRSQPSERVAWQEKAAAHPLYDWVPRHQTQIPPWAIGTCGTWALLGNDEDGIFGERLREPREPTYTEFLKWSRPGANFGHNFNWHVIGNASAQPKTHFDILYLDSREGISCLSLAPGKVLGKGRWSFNLTLNTGRPYVGARLGFLEMGGGWKESGGFGFCFRKAHVQKKEPKASTAD